MDDGRTNHRLGRIALITPFFMLKVLCRGGAFSVGGVLILLSAHACRQAVTARLRILNPCVCAGRNACPSSRKQSCTAPPATESHAVRVASALRTELVCSGVRASGCFFNGRLTSVNALGERRL